MKKIEKIKLDGIYTNMLAEPHTIKGEYTKIQDKINELTEAVNKLIELHPMLKGKKNEKD
jgi:hypothetical protein